jgi:hypothetical protein
MRSRRKFIGPMDITDINAYDLDKLRDDDFLGIVECQNCKQLWVDFETGSPCPKCSNWAGQSFVPKADYDRIKIRLAGHKFVTSFEYTVIEDDSDNIKTTTREEERRTYSTVAFSDAVDLLLADNEMRLNEIISKDLKELSIQTPGRVGEIESDILTHTEGANWVSTTYRLQIKIERIAE